MIGKVLSAGRDAGNLVRYCMGQGNKQNVLGEDVHLHVDQRTVAGNCAQMVGASKEGIAQASADLRAFAAAWEPGSRDLIRHHCLAANPGDRAITDAEWRSICTEYVREMYGDPDSFRWTAINHGENAAGADHVHVIVNRVTTAGGLLSDAYEERRCQGAVVGIEDRHELRVLESRRADVGDRRGLDRAEVEQARRHGRDPVRDYLSDSVRGNALLAKTPAEWLRMMAEDRVEIAPKVIDGEMVGYSARDMEQQGKARWYKGKDLGEDLSWPKLQNTWANPNDARQMSAHDVALRQQDPRNPREVAKLYERVAKAKPAEFRALSRELSGACAVAAKVERDPVRRAELTAAARDHAKWAGRGPANYAPRTVVTGAARLIRDVSRGELSSGTVLIAAVDAGVMLLGVGRALAANRSLQASFNERGLRHAQYVAREQARATVQPGSHYRTDRGDVVRIERSKQGRVYALAQGVDGRWGKADPDRVVDAAAGRRMTSVEVQDHRRSSPEPRRGTDGQARNVTVTDRDPRVVASEREYLTELGIDPRSTAPEARHAEQDGRTRGMRKPSADRLADRQSQARQPDLDRPQHLRQERPAKQRVGLRR